MPFEVITDLPLLPPPHDGRSRRAVYPFGIMPLGSYFIIRNGDGLEKIRTAADIYKSRNPPWNYQIQPAPMSTLLLRRLV